MMEFLLELMTEEMPPPHVKSALTQLAERLITDLEAAGLLTGPEKFPGERGDSLRTTGTCRRLVVVAEVEPAQPGREDQVIGPPRTVAFNPDGTPTTAALGFARSRGVDVSRLEVIRTEKGEYVGFKRTEPGKPAESVLPEILLRAVSGLTFPKMMRWGENPFRFSRPIKNILCLLDGKILPFSMAGVEAVDSTLGHRIFARARFSPRSFEEFRLGLLERNVVIEDAERRKIILEQAEALLSPLGARIHPDPELLDRLVYDIESPLVFQGEFSEEYLNLPLEVLSTAMREGQRLFSVVKGKKQLPTFIGVADSPGDGKGLIRRGNERVLRARLEDARFFWEQDLKIPLRKRAEGLRRVVFQEKLGSYEEKTLRLKKIAAYLCDKLEAGEVKQDVALAAEICKSDLLTDMVREFPSLQGRMGGLLAKTERLSPETSRAVYEHYQPLSLEDESPASVGGAILSLADKMDSIVGALGLSLQVSGSSDPFGLRRNAHGVCKIVLDRKLSFSFPRLLDKVIKIYGGKLSVPASGIKEACQEFFLGRLRYVFERAGYRYDLVNAALGPGLENLLHSSLRLKALSDLRSSDKFEPFILMAKRVNNIVRGHPVFKLNPAVFAEKEERELQALTILIRQNIGPLLKEGDFAQAQKIVFRLQAALNVFFDKVLVMAEEPALRRNRLALLQSIHGLLDGIADYSQVVVEGERG